MHGSAAMERQVDHGRFHEQKSRLAPNSKSIHMKKSKYAVMRAISANLCPHIAGWAKHIFLENPNLLCVPEISTKSKNTLYFAELCGATAMCWGNLEAGRT